MHPEVRQKIYVRISAASRGSESTDVEWRTFHYRTGRTRAPFSKGHTFVGTSVDSRSGRSRSALITTKLQGSDGGGARRRMAGGDRQHSAAYATRPGRPRTWRRRTRPAKNARRSSRNYPPNQSGRASNRDEAEILRLTDELIKTLPPRDMTATTGRESTRERTRRKRRVAQKNQTSAASPASTRCLRPRHDYEANSLQLRAGLRSGETSGVS